MFGVEDISLVTRPELFSRLHEREVVLLDGNTGPITAEQEEVLCTFIERGGGLVCYGDAAEVYHEYPRLGQVLGEIQGMCAAQSEIIVRVAQSDTYLTRRAEPTFAVFEAVYLLGRIPHTAQVHWTTTWRYSAYTLAYSYQYGAGRIFCTTLGSAEETLEIPVFQQMLGRAIRYVAGAGGDEKPIRIAMIGYGAIGFEHGTAISNVTGLEYAIVCDRNEERLRLAQSAFPRIETCMDLADIENDPTIDMVIVSTPPNTHAEISLRMLRAGKHVVSEKPFCLTGAEADEMISVAKDYGRMLTVYQCRRWDADYLAIKEVIRSGRIGPIFHMETFIGGYGHPCDYWHSHEPISGGVFYDWGSHYLDWILQLVPDRVSSVRGIEHKRVWQDVTNADQSSVYLRFAQGQEAEFLHSDIAAIMKPKWYILGERGAIVGHWRKETIKTRRWSGDLIEEQLAPSEAMPELFVHTRERNGAIHEQRLTLQEAPQYAFHRNLANHLHNGEALAVPPEESRRNIAVMEAAKLSAKQGGKIIELDC